MYLHHDSKEIQKIWHRRRQASVNLGLRTIPDPKIVYNVETLLLERDANYFGKHPETMEVLENVDIPGAMLLPAYRIYVRDQIQVHFRC